MTTEIMHEAIVSPQLADDLTAIVEEAAAHVEAEVARMIRSIHFTHDDISRLAGEAVRDVFRRHQFRVSP